MADSLKESKGDVADPSPPEAKKPKLKQASLFDVLKPKATSKVSNGPPKTQILSPISNNKKRKSTDLFHIVNQKGARVVQSENITKSKRLKVDDGENEVSSSSEQEAVKNQLAATKENIPGSKQVKGSGSLDRFVRTTQQREVSTSCAESEEVVDLTDDSSSRPEAEQVIPDSSLKDERENSLGEENEKVDGAAATDGHNDSATPETPKTEPDQTKELNKSTASAKDDTEDSMEVESDLDSSVVTDEANKTLDTTISETDSPTTNSGPSTPASRRPKKAVISSSKKEERERERQRLKEEKEKQREKERQEKQKERDAAKAEKERLKKEEKERKEKERVEQKVAKEKERHAKLEQLQKEKDEKQKKKQAEIDAKNEEKRKKEEEKKKVEVEKKKAEEEKEAKKKQNKMKFKSFFKQQEKPVTSSPKPEEVKSRFMAFQIKDNMKLAPAYRRQLLSKDRTVLDDAMINQGSLSYLSELKGRKTGTSGKTWVKEDFDVICTDEENQKTGTVMKAKFLHFHENHRPPYYGTWRKVSKSIKPRRPLVQDTEFLDYEVDSDDEWEEEEPGESLSNSEKEDDQEDGGGDDDDEEDDGFFVPHGYLSDDELNEDDEEDDTTPERMKARQLAKAKAFEAEMKKQTKAMNSLVIGCVWWNPHTSGTQSDPNFNKLAEFTIQLLSSESYPIDLSCQVKEEGKSKKNKSDDKGANFQPVPDEAIPDLARLVHGNSASIQKLIKEFREYWRIKSLGGESKVSEKDPGKDSPMEVDQNTPEVHNSSTSETPTKGNVFSKRQLDMKIKSIAVYEKREALKRNCWYVHQKVLEEHCLTDLPIPSEWQWITKPNVTPKIATTPKSGRKTPTLAATPIHAKIQQFAVKMTPEQLAEMMPKPEPKPAPAPPPVNSPATRPNIQQFTVKMTPQQLSTAMSPRVENKVPKMMSPKVESKASPAHVPNAVNSLQQMLRKTTESKVPSVSTIPKSVFEQVDGAVPSTSGSNSDTATSVFQRMIIGARQAHYQKIEADSTSDNIASNKSISNEDDDCMIVDEEGPTLPLVAPKGQPTLFSVLKKSIV